MISSLGLKNFKCFEDETLELSSLNLLAGLNGMGKSTAIQALLLLRQNYNAGTLRETEKLVLNGNLVNIGNTRDMLYANSKKREISIEIITETDLHAQWVWDAGEYKDNHIWGMWDGEEYVAYLRFKSLTVNKPQNGGRGIFELPLFRENFHYLSAERLGPRSFYEKPTHEILSKNQMGTQGEYTINYLNEYASKDIPIVALKHPLSKGLKLYEQVNAWLGEIRPGTSVNIRKNLDVNIVYASYRFIGTIGFRSANVGFGFSYILPVLVAILNSTPGSLIILENPEAHLHPMAQATMGRLFAIAASNGVQLIVETHSDHIINGVRVAVKEGVIEHNKVKILFFTGDVIEGKFVHYVLTPQIYPNGRLGDLPEGFLDEWGKQLLRII
ncbi:putative P-loop ATP-binding protein [Candidatus Magnetobacterium bavaricum]|uniref:Putative P-loop ATP-binding protein n=1 Tax=Candidatus Magnetobacterium bavaricum TaxID=29290 RepID=A0A0F3GQV1_9BACT|nr:putative P-loop ATP-binding protein [Candidatus Magnetobacterium bavaricum]